ncbi:glycosyltransferase [Cohnella luojiensis]|uniref:Glycosyltransferase n=1 Tax=Cohnella luojiensis TaxID=652876 RepID=A0A4Y8M0X8_9BACL|nr:glycosyltransferase [Cohnella luojiensis]TFE27181.1 glycosyltransferase [Cohnella luojiensis]
MKQLTVFCPLFDASGYAEAARSIIFALIADGYEIRVIPKDGNKLDAGLPALQKQKLLQLCGTSVFPDGPIIHICAAQFFLPVWGRINIGMTMLECDSLPLNWVTRCNLMDQVWVPSTFNEQTFLGSGVRQEKIKVVPIGVDVNRFHPEVAPLHLERDHGRFVFLSNFEWIPRKGYNLLLRAFLEEFTGSDHVLLVIKTYDGSGYDSIGTRMCRYWNEMVDSINVSDPPLLQFITHGLSYEQIPSFYRAGFCYIIPTHGEGWNLPALEALSSGIPVITTNWSAHLDFVNLENGYLIEVEHLASIPRFGIPSDAIYNGSRWAVPSLSYTRKWMRYAVEHPEEIKEKGKLARQQVVRNWSTVKMVDRIDSLLFAIRCNG